VATIAAKERKGAAKEFAKFCGPRNVSAQNLLKRYKNMELGMQFHSLVIAFNRNATQLAVMVHKSIS
jgi:hypothetical protein